MNTRSAATPTATRSLSAKAPSPTAAPISPTSHRRTRRSGRISPPSFERSKKGILSRFPDTLKGVPHGWTPVRSLQGDYYVDGLNPYPVWVSDSLFIRQTTDGPVPALIESAERIGPAHYRLRTKLLYDSFERVDIYLVDTVRTIAVFTFANDEKGTRYRALYAPFETGLGMDRVDYYSLELPEDEVEWDDIDFDALISGAERTPETDQKQNKTNKE